MSFFSRHLAEAITVALAFNGKSSSFVISGFCPSWQIHCFNLINFPHIHLFSCIPLFWFFSTVFTYTSYTCDLLHWCVEDVLPITLYHWESNRQPLLTKITKLAGYPSPSVVNTCSKQILWHHCLVEQQVAQFQPVLKFLINTDTVLAFHYQGIFHLQITCHWDIYTACSYLI